MTVGEAGRFVVEADVGTQLTHRREDVARRVGNGSGPREVEGRRSARAQRERRDVHHETLRVTTFEHTAQQRAPAFHEHLQHALAPEQLERLAEVDTRAAGPG